MQAVVSQQYKMAELRRKKHRYSITNVLRVLVQNGVNSTGAPRLTEYFLGGLCKKSLQRPSSQQGLQPDLDVRQGASRLPVSVHQLFVCVGRKENHDAIVDQSADAHNDISKLCEYLGHGV